MAGCSKTLSISYGGFRCTLDGFEDPLQTMTAILDYLRYLEAIAGDTGVAPGTPDLDILTGIAARGLEDKVEAREQGGGFHLRVAGTGGAVAPDTPRPDGQEIPETRSAGAACATAARVLRIRRADLDRLVDHGVLHDDAGPACQRADSTLPPEAEIALQRDLARIEAGETPDAPPDAPPADDLSRIFEETDSHLGAPAASRRRNAIQHLRAALAASRAQTRPAPQPRRARDEASQGHVPRAIARQRGTPPRMAGRRSAPLHLGTEQRVDAPQDAPPEDFATFVGRANPTGLPALIEAAAAYMTDCDGQPRFSRPLLMEKLDLIGVADTREDMLRAFESLLQAGKLRRCSDGRYAITESTGFRAAPP
ncbi:hypothetical protein [Roseovarius sp. D22-M7]|uniref:hypothetical protein n=1 Tax=Roseovarius sp. D22-M7 TaxID=3127116 RepID=UPI00301007E3